MENEGKILFVNVKNQRDAVLWHLQNFGSISSWEAIKEYGATRLAAIIKNLRDDGYNVDSENVSARNRFGNTVTYSKYIYADFDPNNSEAFTNNKSLL